MKLTVFISLVLIAISCGVSERKINKWKAEIIQTERDFSYMAGREGIAEAFAAFAAEDVVLLRNGNLIKGKEGLISFFSNRASADSISLTWAPDFADVSSSGDMGYTYGTYTYTVTDTTGQTSTHKGIFHTVWKRQKNGEWKFVWD